MLIETHPFISYTPTSGEKIVMYFDLGISQDADIDTKDWRPAT